MVLSDTAEFLYKTTDYYAPEHERCIAWNDPTLAIAWPDLGEPRNCLSKIPPVQRLKRYTFNSCFHMYYLG